MNGLESVNRFLKHPEEGNTKTLIACAEKGLTEEEILLLAIGLAESGRVIKDGSSDLADIPSSGGPGSLSTLISPLFLRILGKRVLKLGVPGRPAGGIDVLSLIDGYTITPKPVEIEQWMRETGYVHFLVSDEFAPLDSLLFNYRKAHNALSIPSLVIASILAKKIAVGIKYVGLDIRVSPFGNFGSNWYEARNNGKLFNKVASLAGLSSKCFITSGLVPQQPYIGRGEALLALSKVFSGDCDRLLKKHLHQCFSMAQSVSGVDKHIPLSAEKLAETFYENIDIQGGSQKSFKEIARITEESHVHSIIAQDNGFVIINLGAIRTAIVKMQQLYQEKLFSDPCGVILIATSYDYIQKGESLCTFRCVENERDVFVQELKKSFEITPRLTITNDFEEIS